MTYRELFYKATRLIDKGKITLGEYEEMTKPLDREIEQEPILDRVRAEIETIIGEHNLDDYDFCSGLICARKIIDKYKAEQEKV